MSREVEKENRNATGHRCTRVYGQLVSISCSCRVERILKGVQAHVTSLVRQDMARVFLPNLTALWQWLNRSSDESTSTQTPRGAVVGGDFSSGKHSFLLHPHLSEGDLSTTFSILFTVLPRVFPLRRHRVFLQERSCHRRNSDDGNVCHSVCGVCMCRETGFVAERRDETGFSSRFCTS